MSMGCPFPQYIKEGGGGGRPRAKMRPRRGVLLPLGVGLLPFLVGVGEEGRRRKGEGKGGRPPHPIRIGLGGARPHLGCCLLSSTKAHEGPLTPRGVSVTPRYSVTSPVTSKTIPVSEYNLPIYQSLCLDHFETPRHVRDHIRDSEQPSVHQNT